MKFGIREICDVVMKAKTPMKVGKKVFYKDEPVLYFDTLKTSSLEGASTTVYATGGRGNTRLIAWDGERTITYTMEDALISPEGLMILTGAGLIEATENNTIKQHIVETTDDVHLSGTTAVKIYVEHKPYTDDANNNYTYVMVAKDGEPITEPFLPLQEFKAAKYDTANKQWITANVSEADAEKWEITIPGTGLVVGKDSNGNDVSYTGFVAEKSETLKTLFEGATVIVDYYTERTSNAKQIEITAESFGGNFYLEASTLFRNQDGADLPAEFIIPNCKVQSNFTFSMASSGDPSTFTFTLDAFPGYTRFDTTKKVLAAIQVIEDTVSENMYRTQTVHSPTHDTKFI